MRHLVIVVLASACGLSPTQQPEVSRDAIIGGTADSSHEAVGLIRSSLTSKGYGECTGTVFSVDPDAGTAWVVTAAHCLADFKPVTVILGGTPSAPTAKRYAVLDYASAPYSGTPTETSRDVAVVRIIGVDSTTPFMPLTAANDSLDAGAIVISIGYGITVPVGPDAAPQLRRAISRPLSAVGPTFVRYHMQDGIGVCSGDSGGPVIADGRVVGVHSYVDPDCSGDGTSVRLSSELAFVNDAIAKPSQPLNTCALCGRAAESGNNLCAKRREACATDPDCATINTCRSSCTSQACADACVTSNPKGAAAYNSFQRCSCLDVCASECAANASCQALPKCGPVSNGGCEACGQQQCCDSRVAASSDKLGSQCLLDPSVAGCQANSAYQLYLTCRASACSSMCAAVMPADAGAIMTISPTNPAPGCSAMPMRSLIGALLVVLAVRTRGKRRPLAQKSAPRRGARAQCGGTQ